MAMEEGGTQPSLLREAPAFCQTLLLAAGSLCRITLDWNPLRIQ